MWWHDEKQEAARYYYYTFTTKLLEREMLRLLAQISVTNELGYKKKQ